MSGAGADKLVDMANQIAAYFAAYPHDRAVHGVAEHLEQFWSRKMRDTILEHREHGGGGLEPLAAEALGLLAAKRHQGAGQTS